MDGRVSRLEDLAGDARERLARIETKLEQVAHDTGQWKWFLVGAAVTLALAIIGTGVSIQQMTVSTFQAAGQQAQQPTTAPPSVIINVPPGTSQAAPVPHR